MITTILYDLDGTLLPMDNDVFTKAFFKELLKKGASGGFDPAEMEEAMWKGTGAMVKNDGSRLNEVRFWDYFCDRFSVEKEPTESFFNDFYRGSFDETRKVCSFNPLVPELIAHVKGLGYRQVLATNPIFPAIATAKRIGWAGLKPEDFELYTTYENSSFCKPNPAYYDEILQKIGVLGKECLMVGNDVDEDMIAQVLGMKVFLITDWVLNRHQKDISVYPHGSFEDLRNFIDALERP